MGYLLKISSYTGLSVEEVNVRYYSAIRLTSQRLDIVGKK
jgi:hypothetical protein